MKWVIGSVAFLGLVLFASAKGKASPTSTVLEEETFFITDHDSVYDYKFENGRWYTQKKGAIKWIDMENNLSPENYTIAINRLTKHINGTI